MIGPVNRTGGRLALLAALGVTAVPVVASGVARADAATPTSDGHAQAVFAKLVPYLGLPGVDTSLGTTTAQVSGGTAQASAGVADFGLIGAIANANADDSSSKAPKLALPEPISADSQRTQHAEGNPFDPPGAPAPPANSPFSDAHQSATATPQPLAAEGSATGPSLNLPGVLSIVGGSSLSTVRGGTSTGTVTISQIELGGGAVVLSGLRWSATEVAGKAGVPTFSVGSLSVAGQSLPVGSAEQMAAAVDAANKLLDPTGLSLTAPVATTGAAQGDIGPLTIQFRNPQSLVGPSGQAGAAAAPVIQALVKQIIAAYPDAAAAQIVANALVGASGGRSGGRLELGGVSVQEVLQQADDSAGAVPAAPPGTNPGLPSPVPPVGNPAVAVGPAGVAAPGTVGTAEPSAPATPVGTRTVAFPVPHSSNRAWAATAVGIGLLLLLILAVVDRLRAA